MKDSSLYWLQYIGGKRRLAFMPYCSFAMKGLSEIKVNSFLRQVNGIGMINAMKTIISNIRRRKTW
jgi:hypothetical protein